MFRMLVERNGVGGQLAAGEYELSPSMSTGEVVSALAQGRVRRGIAVTVPEGWRAEEIAWKLDAIAPGAGGDFLDVVSRAEPYAALVDLPSGASLEGFLFPDTYDLPQTGPTAALLVARMVGRFRDVIGPELPRIEKSGRTVREVVILASLVEMETARPEARSRHAALLRVVRQLTEVSDPDTLMRCLVDEAVALLRGQVGSVACWSEDEGVLKRVWSTIPLVVEIPSRGGVPEGQASLGDIVLRAIGIKL